MTPEAYVTRRDAEFVAMEQRAEKAEADLAEYKAMSEDGAENMGHALSDSIDAEERMKAEVARLRAALERISAEGWGEYGGDRYARIADVALDPK